MRLAVDFGSSFAKIVLAKGGKIVEKYSFSAGEKKKIDQKAGEIIKKRGLKSVYLTGGNRKRRLKANIKQIRVEEIGSIGIGGSHLSGLKNCIVVSVGTGTCIVEVKNSKIRHLGGTAVGGGTILGLSKLILKEDKWQKIAAYARTGNHKRVDLSVKEIVGENIGLLYGNVTASNFGRIKSYSKKDLAAGIFNMVAEVVGMMAVMSSGKLPVCFTGKTVENKKIKERITLIGKLFNKKFIFPKNRGYANALGAII